MKSVSVKFKKNKKNFEILVNHGTVEKWRKGNLAWNKVMTVDEVFKNAKKGDRYTDSELQLAFETTDLQNILQTIAGKGDLQLTTEDRRKKAEEKRRQIIQHLHKYYVDPKTNNSHPVQRIENALQQIKFNVSMDHTVEKQVQAILKKLPGVLAVKKTVMEGVIVIPNEHMGKAYGVISKWCSIEQQSYKSDGCYTKVSVVPGMYDSLMAELNQVTKGNFTFDVEGQEQQTTTTNSKNLRKKDKKSKKKSGRRNQNYYQNY